MNNVIKTKLGPVSLIWEKGRLERVVIGSVVESKEEVPEEIRSLFVFYFLGKPVDFKIVPIREFEDTTKKKILEMVRNIGWGETRTYKDIGDLAGIRNYRLVGRILSLNPLPIVIPCHRVVGKKGLGGFSVGISWKRYFLELEGII